MKTISFVLVSTFFTYLIAQDCNNPLLTTFGLEGLDTPQIGQGLPFCNNLQNGQTCCSFQTVESFQSRLDNLTTSLQELAGQRDVYLTELFANYSDTFQRAEDDLTDYSDEVVRIQRANPSLGDEIRSQYRDIERISRALDRIDDRFRSSVQEYQQRRTNCLNTVLKIQSSAWCLACDANYANIGVQPDGSVNSSPEVCNTIMQDCWPYVQQTNYLNPLFQAQQAYQRLLNLTNLLRDYKRNNYVLPENVTLDNDIFVSENDTERTSALPPNCTNTTCEWQCSNFFSSDFVLNNSIVSNGGGVLGGDDIDYPPIAVNVPQGRLLQNLQEETVWNPDLEATGLNFTVVDDPADVAAILNDPIFDDSSDTWTDNDGIDTTNQHFDTTDHDGFDTTHGTTYSSFTTSDTSDTSD